MSADPKRCFGCGVHDRWRVLEGQGEHLILQCRSCGTKETLVVRSDGEEGQVPA